MASSCRAFCGEIPFAPPAYPRRHLYGSHAPVLAVVVSLILTAHPSALQSLFFREGSEDAKDDRHAGVELHAHERLGNALADVLEVQGRALDEHSDRDHRVEGFVLGAREVGGQRPGAARDGRDGSWGADV